MILYANGHIDAAPIASELGEKLNYDYESGFLKSNTNQKVLDNTTKFINSYSKTRNRYELLVLIFVSSMRNHDEWFDKLYKYHLFLRRKGIKHLFVNNNFVFDKISNVRGVDWHNMYYGVNNEEIEEITVDKLYDFIC